MWDANLRALAAYQPIPYPGEVTLFRATISDPLEDYGVTDLGWAPFVSGDVHICKVPGTHDSLVREPNVKTLVAELKLRIDRVRETTGLAV
jgi:thioesterase domain-containing protein